MSTEQQAKNRAQIKALHDEMIDKGYIFISCESCGTPFDGSETKLTYILTVPLTITTIAWDNYKVSFVENIKDYVWVEHEYPNVNDLPWWITENAK